MSFVFTCRADGPVEDGFHDVAMIGHDQRTGATCFFQSFPEAPRARFPSPLTDDPVWELPAHTADTACHRCHAADPWIHTPWVDGAAVDGEPIVPVLPAPAYSIVGTAFADWMPETLTLPGNACTTCHALSAHSCSTMARYAGGLEAGLPLTEAAVGLPWMPPEGEVPEADLQALIACCDDPALPGCGG